MHMDPEWMTREHCQRIVRWLEANGCRDYIDLQPIIVRGRWIEYVALCRKNDEKGFKRQLRGAELVPLGRKRLRIRVPLAEVA